MFRFFSPRTWIFGISLGHFLFLVAGDENQNGFFPVAHVGIMWG